jgi:hypothetical protein
MLHGLVAIRRDDDIRFVSAGFAITGPRGVATVRLLREWLAELCVEGRSPVLPRSFVVVAQPGDRSYHEIASFAYAKACGEAPAVRLVPDPFFFETRAHAYLRQAAATGDLPAWRDRQDLVFWRGSATHDGYALDGRGLERVDEIPRVAMCLSLRDRPDTDAAIMAPWSLRFAEDEQVALFTAENIYRPGIAMLDHARYRYLIDIDGVACAWSLFEKLLLGSCVLKVLSPYEQWFYDRIVPWEHFVPLQRDFSDLGDKIDWCRSHPAETGAIAAAGQQFATQHTYEAARQIALEAVGDCLVPL